MKDKFLNYLCNIRKYSNNTIINYKIDIDRYEKFLKTKHKNIDSIEYKDVLDFISYIKNTHKSTCLYFFVYSMTYCMSK